MDCYTFGTANTDMGGGHPFQRLFAVGLPQIAYIHVILISVSWHRMYLTLRAKSVNSGRPITRTGRYFMLYNDSLQ